MEKYQLPPVNNILNFENARLGRKQPTEAENVLWQVLRGRSFMNLKFRRQHPLFNYIADFYCHELKLIIEVDGEYHFTEEQQIKDALRTEDLQNENFKVVRFSNDEILFNLDVSLHELTKLITKLKEPKALS